MADRALSTMAGVVRLRQAQTEIARAETLAADAALARAGDTEAQAGTERDAAEHEWRVLLGSRWPDPALMGLAGAWLVDRERGLGAANLDTAIARDALDAADEALGRSRARLDASREVEARLVREAARRREDRDLADACDAYLMRRRP